ncbi:MAG: class I SAM-dependent methyltransferase [Candidatus Aenigmatarchaeota archaeon]|nr:class I SAM-dependent methyltransferase [Nanoarchaeota archaeon]
MKNVFDVEICEIKDVFKDKDIEKVIHEMLSPVILYTGIPNKEVKDVIDRCIFLAKNYKSLSEYEKNAHDIIKSFHIEREISHKLEKRAQMIYNQIKPHVIGKSILDLGCGDGMVGEFLRRDRFSVVISDIYKHPNTSKSDLEFKTLHPKKNIPFDDNSFDTTLVLTVFHHSVNPIKTLTEAHRVTKPGGRVIVIESVYDVDGKELSENEKNNINNYLSLNKDQQITANIFFDHFYNRIIHYNQDPEMKVSVPFNFNTPEGWRKLFETNGFKQENVIHLGVDRPLVPEYHTLHILRTEK